MTPPSDVNSERGRREGGQLQPTQGAGHPQNRAGSSASLPTQSEGAHTGDGDQPVPTSLQGGFPMSRSPNHYASRCPLFRSLSRSSSGYFSFDSESISSPPPMSHNKSTQTPSPASQIISHAQHCLAQQHENAQGHDIPQAPPGPYRPRSLSMPTDMRPEVWVAQELRRIGDEFNCLYQRDIGGRNGRAAQNNHNEVQNEQNFMRWLAIVVRRLFQIYMRWH
ncbi:bcl-2-like protein 11 isoform X2 [Acipenser ruthenus]|uniref:bcl-2-like protein 11 isoform X2 n=1 Tax=Acipenser ruthenus TaxID=7906 RepID=UPI00145A07CF|nr:bcl-2-like protein 11 isoform X2 [Acipenser ruthenus]